MRSADQRNFYFRVRGTPREQYCSDAISHTTDVRDAGLRISTHVQRHVHLGRIAHSLRASVVAQVFQCAVSFIQGEERESAVSSFENTSVFLNRF